MILIFLFVVRPLLKSLKAAPKKPALVGAELSGISIEDKAFEKIPEPRRIAEREKAIELSKNNPDRAEKY